ncbi:MAG: dethiobiotin synthase [Gammaproteobacteria bacterium]|nr:MAG: dethiobiotin synthase [Gammaproteobacteria bacterium]
MTQAYFVTATDTDAGKTVVSTALLSRWRRQGYSTLGLKPVAAGAEMTRHGLRNDDALALMSASSVNVPYEHINPVCLAPPIAPHIALQKSGMQTTIEELSAQVRKTMADFPAQRVVVEGAGGWRVPLNDSEDLSELASTLALSVILVVPLKLGCLSMARLTAEAVLADGCTLAGWIGNRVTPETMSEEAANLTTLHRILPAPCLGVLPFDPVPAGRPERLGTELSCQGGSGCDPAHRAVSSD